MKTARITTGGQVSIPAEVRKRWGTSSVLLDDQGEVLVVRPLPPDPLAAAIGSLAGPGPTSAEARRLQREEDAAAEGRRRT